MSCISCSNKKMTLKINLNEKLKNIKRVEGVLLTLAKNEEQRENPN
jgi:Fe-S cluster biogenesis protein NfuA